MNFFPVRYFLGALLLCGGTEAAAVKDNNTWFKWSKSDTVFVFVHGIFSDSSECWTAPNGVFWPHLVAEDQRLKTADIFLAGYYTDFGSGIYRISDAASELLANMRINDTSGEESLLTRKNVIFIAHSTGGLVVRYMLDANRKLFEEKCVGLVLLASPSRGSEWANRLKLISQAYSNKMASQLQRDNDFVMDLDQRFARLVSEGAIPGLTGVDLFENKFIIKGLLWNSTHVVNASDSASYFGAYRIIPNTDHFSIAKPQEVTHASHVALVDFYLNRFLPHQVKFYKERQAPSLSSPSVHPSKVTRYFIIDETNSDHKSFETNTKPYRKIFKADPGYVITDWKWLEESATRKSDWVVNLDEGGLAIIVEFKLKAGPKLDRYRGWVKGRLETTQIKRP